MSDNRDPFLLDGWHAVVAAIITAGVVIAIVCIAVYHTLLK